MRARPLVVSIQTPDVLIRPVIIIVSMVPLPQEGSMVQVFFKTQCPARKELPLVFIGHDNLDRGIKTVIQITVG